MSTVTVSPPAAESVAAPADAGLAGVATLLANGARGVRLAPREKRPVGLRWQDRSTDDLATVAGWIDAGANIGLLLGEASGLIDVETDSAEGEALAQYFKLDHLHGAGFTPTWRSARGVHRLYRWEPWMPATATIDLGGLEVRIGGRAAQSVLPPSRHPGGAIYRWEISPWMDAGGDVVAELPHELRQAIAGRGGR